MVMWTRVSQISRGFLFFNYLYLGHFMVIPLWMKVYNIELIAIVLEAISITGKIGKFYLFI